MAQNFNTDDENTANTFDGSGNPTNYGGTALTFDGLNRLLNYGTAFSNGYDGSDRAWTQTASGTTYYLNSGGVPLCELDSNGNVQAVNTFGVAGLTSRYTTANGGTTTNYSFDPSGNTAERYVGGNLISSTLVDAFGNAQSQGANTDPFGGFGGQSGWSRQSTVPNIMVGGSTTYDTNAGRPLSPMPMGGGGAGGGGVNPYAFAGNNPVSNPPAAGGGSDESGGPDDLPDGEIAGNGSWLKAHGGWRNGAKMGQGFANSLLNGVPLYGFYPALTGHDAFGCPLSPWERLLSGANGAASMLPFAGGAGELAAEEAADEAAASLSAKQANAVKKIENTLGSHLKGGHKGEIAGALRDLLGRPVLDSEGVPYQHLKEVQNAYSGLVKRVKELYQVTDPNAAAIRQRAIQMIRKLESLFTPQELGRGRFQGD